MNAPDRIVTDLAAAHDAREVFPTGHLVTMTHEVDGKSRALSVATCECGAIIRLLAIKHLEMDAAVEAHWQRFDHVDDRGQPVGTLEGCSPSSVTSLSEEKVKCAPTNENVEGSAPTAGVPSTSEPAAADSSAPQPPAAAGSLNEAPPIGGGDEDDIAVDWPSYGAFLEDKIVTAPVRGIEVRRDELHDWLKPHCKDLTLWALRLGCAAIFANFGLHKTAMQLEWVRQLSRRHSDAPTLCVLPLGVRHGFIDEAQNEMGMRVLFIRSNTEFAPAMADGVRHFLTNYESIRDGKLDPNLFVAVSLDEASVLRSFGSKTYQEFLPLFDKVPFKLVATATPSPNRYKELIHYSGFLGVMDTGQALTRFFQRNSEKAGDLTLYPHKEEEFWMWVHSWAAFLQAPSDLGYSDDGYELPPLKINWHEVAADHSKAKPERDGQGVMFRDVAKSLSDAAHSRRDSLATRVAKMMQIIGADPQAHRVIWHDLEAEREAIEAALPDVVTISGSMDIDDREIRLRDFEEGRIKYFGTKPILSGSGSNFQYHCHKAIYVALPGYGYKFNDFLQSLHRLQRFGQQHPVEVDIIYAEDERAGRSALEEKWARDIEMRGRMSAIIKQYGLDTLPLRDTLVRSIGVKRIEVRGEKFTAINNDAVAECSTWAENSVDQIITSIPFSNHYEYTNLYNDFGHTDDNAHFWSQMDFLTAELLRMLKPGRLACIHVKDRVLFGSVTGQGVPTISPFHAEALMHYRAHGFQYMGMITVVTDVVRENNQTYRLGWSENCKDGSKMGVGSPEYVLLMRKPQSDRTRSYADVPVVKDKLEGDGDGYSCARWQIDAHAFWRSSGDRLLTFEEFAELSSADLAKLFAKTSAARVYDYEAHVKIGEAVERTGALPATFMAIAPGSSHPDVWTDINRMHTLNMMQQRKGAEMHLCLAKGSRVLTRRHGYVPIEDVGVGEDVLTHRGRWRPVLVKSNTGLRPVVTLKAQGVPGLMLTADHKLWARKVPADAWSVMHSRRAAAEADPSWFPASDLGGSYVNLKLPPTERPSVGSLLHWWIVGRWLAYGHYSTAKSFVISCGKHEVEGLVETLGPFARAPRDVGTAMQIILRDADGALRDRLKMCGRGAGGKKLPTEAFTLPHEQASALLHGYLSGDGHFLEERQRWMASSISRTLLLEIAILVQRVHGAIASIHSGRKPGFTIIQGRTVQTHQEWVLSFDLPHEGRYKGLPFVMHDGAWKKVRSIEVAGEAETWNLRVAEDESYTAEGCIVKNCPLQFDVVDRLIERYSNPGELIFDPFGGLMTVPYRAILKGRRGAATELNAQYFLDGVHYLHAAEEKVTTPALFDLASFDAANAPPPGLSGE